MQKAAGRRQNKKSGWLICCALKEEVAPFRKLAMSKSGISILFTGIGRQNAEQSVREFLAANSPELVLTCGFAGGLNPDLKLGDVVFQLEDRRDALNESSSKSGVRNTRSASLREKLLAAGAKMATFFCANRVAVTAAEKKKLRDESGADAVEMESAAIHAVCLERGIPCITVRVISDTANEDLLLDFNALSRPDKSLDYGKLFWAIAKSPGKTGALMKLQKQTQYAAERLADVLAKIII